jgi:hypothetical protein
MSAPGPPHGGLGGVGSAKPKAGGPAKKLVIKPLKRASFVVALCARETLLLLLWPPRVRVERASARLTNRARAHRRHHA